MMGHDRAPEMLCVEIVEGDVGRLFARLAGEGAPQLAEAAVEVELAAEPLHDVLGPQGDGRQAAAAMAAHDNAAAMLEEFAGGAGETVLHGAPDCRERNRNTSRQGLAVPVAPGNYDRHGG